jgi:hypothetical protein
MNSRRARTRGILISLVLAVLGSFGVASSAAAAGKAVSVYFQRDDRLQIVERPVPAGVDRRRAAADALFAGPNATERRDGIGTAIPSSARVLDLTVVDTIAYVRLSDSFASSGTGTAVELRLAQLVYTLLAEPGASSVRILLGDEPLPAAGEDGGALLDHGSITTREIIGPIPIKVTDVQKRLVQLRYLGRGTVTGRLDYRTSQALLAFQGWEGLSRTGAANLETRRRLTIAKIPKARRATEGRRVEVARFKGVALLIRGGEVVRAVHVSTGAGGRTPRGTFRIYRKERMSWSRPFSVWLPWASYFVGGYAFHQYPHVPGFPASHGCIRIGQPEARGVYEFASFGTVVSVV